MSRARVRVARRARPAGTKLAILVGLVGYAVPAIAFACMPKIDWPDSSAPAAIAEAAYDAASPLERLQIDQANYWNGNPFVFIARIEHVVDPASKAAVGSRLEEDRQAGNQPPIVVSADPSLRRTRRIRIVPLLWLKGTEQPLESSYQVDRMTEFSCGLPTSYLGSAQYGELVVVYARPNWSVVNGKSVQDILSIFAIDADHAVDPRLTSALAKMPK